MTKAEASTVALASELRISVGRLRRRLATENAGAPVSLSGIALLGALERSGPVTVGQLAAMEGVRPPSITRAISTLERHRYVKRTRCKDDGRVIVVEVTDAGREVLRVHRAANDAWLNRRLRELTPAQRQVLAVAMSILERLSRE